MSEKNIRHLLEAVALLMVIIVIGFIAFLASKAKPTIIPAVKARYAAIDLVNENAKMVHPPCAQTAFEGMTKLRETYTNSTDLLYVRGDKDTGYFYPEFEQRLGVIVRFYNKEGRICSDTQRLPSK